MSDTPSWLSDDVAAEVTSSLAANPHVQAAAKKAAKDPKVQKAALDAATSQGPSWAANQNGAADSGDVEVGQAAPASSVNPHKMKLSSVPQEEMSKCQKYHQLLRVAYMANAIFMSFVAVKEMLLQTDVAILCFSFYVLMFSVLICCFEAQLLSVIAHAIAINFGFMYSFIGRNIFLIFVGFMLYTLGTLGIVAMSILFAIGLGQAIMIYKFPFFPEYQRMLHFDKQHT